MEKLILSIDQGTTSCRSILFSLKGKKIFSSQYEFKQIFPKSGWVEHNPEEIWKKTLKTIKASIRKSKLLKAKIISIGITNQRETTILWDKITGKPIYNAIVWQDRRTQNICKNLKKKKLENLFRKKTGLLIDPYFSATKIKWIFDNISKAKKLYRSKRLIFGTIDTFLIWRLTNKKKHYTDATNASRTLMFNINSNKWDDDILKKLKIPKSILPEVKNSADNFGKTSKKIIGKEIPINAVLGDQQAAAVGQACFDIGSIKSTYGTGAFVIMNTGSKKIFSKNKLLTTICYRLNDKNTYALEGSIFIAGAGVQWMRDKVELINSAHETENISKSKIDNDGIYIVPAFTGLGAPHWNSESRGIITGLNRNTDWKNLVRSMIESVAYQSHDLFQSMRRDGAIPKIIKVDGGMVANNWFLQFLSNILNIKVLRSSIKETTALGVAFLAGYQLGEFKSLNEIKYKWKKNAIFTPKIERKLRNKLLQGWKQAIRKTLA